MQKLEQFMDYCKKSFSVIGTIWGIIGISFLSLFRENKQAFFVVVIVFVIVYILLGVYCLSTGKIKMPHEIEGISINTYSMLEKKVKYNKNLVLKEADIEIDVLGADLNINYHYLGSVKAFKKSEGIYMCLTSEGNMQNVREYQCYDFGNNNGKKQPLNMIKESPPGMVDIVKFSFDSEKKWGDTFNVKVQGKTHNVFPLKGKSYYFIKFSFNKPYPGHTIKYNYTMKFDQMPKSVKSYIVSAHGVKFVRDCAIYHVSDRFLIQDMTDEFSVNNMRLYVFER